MYRVNEEIVRDILNNMPAEKKQVLEKALERNLILTSSYVLSSCTLTVYKEGFYIQLEGTRANFSVYAQDNDGDFEYIRKPAEKFLHKLYSQWTNLSESDFYNMNLI